MRRPRGLDETQRVIAATLGIGLVLGAIAWFATVSGISKWSWEARGFPAVGMFVIGVLLVMWTWRRRQPRAALTALFDPLDPQCVQNRADHLQRDVQLRLRVTNTGVVALAGVRFRLAGRHSHYGRIRHDNEAPYSRSSEGIALQVGQSDYFDVAFCHLDQPQMVLQYADRYLLEEQVLPGNATLKADRTPIGVTIEYRRADTNEWLPSIAQRYVVAPDNDAITLISGV